MYQSYKNIIVHLAAILGTAYGWIVAMASWTFNFLAPAGYPFAVVFILVISDLIWGIIVALKLGKFVYSEALRETCTKLTIYGSCLVSVYLIEQLFYSGIAAALFIAAQSTAISLLWDKYKAEKLEKEHQEGK